MGPLRWAKPISSHKLWPVIAQQVRDSAVNSNIETAIKVGRRHGMLVVYEVLSGDMENDGYIYYRSVNDVWLTKSVPI